MRDSSGSSGERSAWLSAATAAIVLLHLGLLLAALPDYRVSNDSAYHTALGRQYGEHGTYFWDDVHYAPAGRPNLQGPLVHVLIGALGRAMGGSGDDYVLANALLGIVCWLAAVVTVAYFARRGGGDSAMLLGVAAFTGSAFAAGSFSVNLPSGWMFVWTAWAVFLFAERRIALAAVFAALACYSHLGGFATAPVGIAAAALLMRRARDLAVTALATCVLTAPYWIHLLLSRAYYLGQKGDTAWLIDPLVDLFFLVGLAFAAAAPRERAFLLAWLAAPIIWLVQDPTRFILQSSLAGAAAGGIAIATAISRWRWRRIRATAIAAIAGVATILPLGVPGLGAEAIWLLRPYPRMLDWAEMRADASAIREARLESRLLWGYASYVPSAVAVFADVRGEKGHWVEVQPPVDPADSMSVGEKVFLLPTSPGDSTLAAWQEKGLVRVHGGGRWSSITTFERRPSIEEATELARETWASEADAIARGCERNALGDWREVFTDLREIPRRTRERGYCRTRVARLAAGLLLYAHAHEPTNPGRARFAATAARGVAWIASLVGDESTLDFRSAEAHEQMLDDMRNLRLAAAQGADMDDAFVRLLENVAGSARGGLAGRSAGTARVRALREAVSNPAASVAAPESTR